jgi:signal peptidase II
MTRVGVRLVLIMAIAATIGCDRVTKHVAATTLAGARDRSFLADLVRLEYVENSGAFLSLGADWPPAVRTALFGIANGVLLVALAVLAMRLRGPRPALIGLALLVGGGTSNLLDRVAYGKVIDFLNVGVGPLRTGIFNVADLAITVGAALIVFGAVSRARAEHRHEA